MDHHRKAESSRLKVGRARLFMLFVAICLCICSVVQTPTITPKGVQCPTAEIQTVRVAIRDCCDKIIGFEVRKPQIGENGFLQCRCAEKKSTAGHDDQTMKVVFSFEALPSNGLNLVYPDRISEIPAHRTLDSRLRGLTPPPLVPPPLA